MRFLQVDGFCKSICWSIVFFILATLVFVMWELRDGQIVCRWDLENVEASSDGGMIITGKCGIE